jgi:hypothetical protein
MSKMIPLWENKKSKTKTSLLRKENDLHRQGDKKGIQVSTPSVNGSCDKKFESSPPGPHVSISSPNSERKQMTKPRVIIQFGPLRIPTKETGAS